MNRQTIFGIFITVIMLTSILGYAFTLQRNNAGNGGNNEYKIETIYNRPLESQEKLIILRNGITIIEFFHTGTESDISRLMMYEGFANRFSSFVVLEAVEVTDANQTIDQMIGISGDIVPLENVTGDDLFDIFCDTAALQPQECVLREI